MSITITLSSTDGNHQRFIRCVEKCDGDSSSTAQLAALRSQIAQVQQELNTALTTQIEKAKVTKDAAGNTSTVQTETGNVDSQGEKEDEEDDEENEESDKPPPEKVRKT